MPTAQHQPLAALSLGEYLEDQFVSGKPSQIGGSPANVAFRLSTFGIDSGLVTRIGRDPLGDKLLQHLDQHGNNTRFVQRDDEGHPTGTVTVYDTSEKVTYTVHPAAWDHIQSDPEALDFASKADLVFFSTLAQRNPVSRATLRALIDAAQNAKRIFDVNLRPPDFSAEALFHGLSVAWLVKIADEELPTVAASLDTAATAEAVTAAIFRNYGPEYVVVTCGSKGSIGYVRQGPPVTAPGYQIEFVDAVGAGDSFLAACAYALTTGRPLPEALDFANRVGALVASKSGGMPTLTAEEIAAL